MVYFIVRGNLFVILLFRSLKMRMSNGSKIRFWEYLWLAVFPLHSYSLLCTGCPLSFYGGV